MCRFKAVLVLTLKLYSLFSYTVFIFEEIFKKSANTLKQKSLLPKKKKKKIRNIDN